MQEKGDEEGTMGPLEDDPELYHPPEILRAATAAVS
jgi:hypothetical protein